MASSDRILKLIIQRMASGTPYAQEWRWPQSELELDWQQVEWQLPVRGCPQLSLFPRKTRGFILPIVLSTLPAFALFRLNVLKE